jgi:hypothetical protein
MPFQERSPHSKRNRQELNVGTAKSTFLNGLKIEKYTLASEDDAINHYALTADSLKKVYDEFQSMMISAEKPIQLLPLVIDNLNNTINRIDGLGALAHLNTLAYENLTDKPTLTTGATGPAGDTGAAGPRGPAGADGSDGARGPAGAVGDTGAAGAAGTNGSDGARGPAGAVGDTGAAGTNGSDGARGPAGAAGADGAVIPGTFGRDGLGNLVNIQFDGRNVVFNFSERSVTCEFPHNLL